MEAVIVSNCTTLIVVRQTQDPRVKKKRVQNSEPYSNLRYQCPKTGINSRCVRVPWTESGLEVIKQSLDIQDTSFADHCTRRRLLPYIRGRLIC